MYSFFRIGKTTNCVQHILKSLHIRLPQQIPALQSHTNLCSGSNWTFYHTRSLYTGVRFCSKNDGQKDTDQVSVSRSSYTPPSPSAAQKGTCITESYYSNHRFRQNTIVMVMNCYCQPLSLEKSRI